jgi:hypothetical protein
MRAACPALTSLSLVAALIGLKFARPDGAARAGVEASPPTRSGPPVTGKDDGPERPTTPAGGVGRSALAIFERRILVRG